MTLEKRTKVLSAAIVILTFVMVFLPAQIAFLMMQKIIIGVTGSLSVLLQIYMLTQTVDKKKRLQGIVLLAFTLITIALMVVVYSSK
ncbi:hypothetical protein [uncultured Arcticibacterium sp.]|uniref:hypothetical protein n=1 Tax=uncultured Arcticibacterium sp. TaxID=2173042 RepID=UPI0030FBB9F8